jgi:hypothetical protein
VADLGGRAVADTGLVDCLVRRFRMVNPDVAAGNDRGVGVTGRVAGRCICRCAGLACSQAIDASVEYCKEY